MKQTAESPGYTFTPAVLSLQSPMTAKNTACSKAHMHELTEKDIDHNLLFSNTTHFSMDILQMHFTRSEYNHMQEFSITLHRETIYSEKINPVCKCLKIIRTAIYCLNKGLLLRNATEMRKMRTVYPFR